MRTLSREARLDDIFTRHEHAIPMMTRILRDEPASALSDDEMAAVCALAKELDRLDAAQIPTVEGRRTSPCRGEKLNGGPSKAEVLQLVTDNATATLSKQTASLCAPPVVVDVAGVAQQIATLPAPAAKAEPNIQQEIQRRILDARREYKREWKRAKRRGEKLPKGLYRQPTTGIMSPMLNSVASVPAMPLDGRFRGRRERANELRERMSACSAVYNAAWHLREAYHGPDVRRSEAAKRLLLAFGAELQRNPDFEAVLYALCDAIYASPLGVPWEP